MRYVGIVVGVLLVAFLGVVLIGLALPVRHRATRQATYSATPATLFALLTDVEQYPTWRSGVERVELVHSGDAGRRFREIGKDGTILYAVESVEPERRLVTRIADPSLPFGGTWTCELTPAGDSTTLRITEDGEVRNPVFRFVSRFVIGHQATIDRYLTDVGRKLGAEVRITD